MIKPKQPNFILMQKNLFCYLYPRPTENEKQRDFIY